MEVSTVVYDIVIKNGNLIDGTGAEAVDGDLAIRDGVIAEVGGTITAAAHRTIDADGAIVTPGWVDVHTHYDAQASWDPYLTPSSWHGVTSAVMGNCGVGFAPAKPDEHDFLIDLMEGVEDIPGTALHEGLSWEWSSFPEYLDDLDGDGKKIIPIGTGNDRAYSVTLQADGRIVLAGRTTTPGPRPPGRPSAQPGAGQLAGLGDDQKPAPPRLGNLSPL
ncbi:MAG: amidohydrolase family protein [Ilumatobacter sp.]|nr:amidohydrolase family protein [Ilumatobacter sp.]